MIALRAEYQYLQGRRFRGFRGACAPLLFCPPRGFLKYIMVLIVLIFPEILLPAVVHLRYLLRPIWRPCLCFTLQKTVF